ncbi:MAG: MFS transporter [Chloroflexi bacterium]|nr:MFS transporter [Chloroflexota bacterium]
MVDSARRKGIFYGWFILAAGFFALFVSTGARSSFGVFIIPMTEDFGWSRSSISAAIAVGWLINGISQPFLGRLYDRMGGRKIISISLVVLGSAIMLMSQIQSLWQLIVIYGFIASIASSGVSMVTIHGVLSKWFRRKRGVVLSLSTAGASAGSLFLVPFATYLIIWANWRVAWFVLGAFVVFLALPLVLLIFKDDPEHIGEQPDGEPIPIAKEDEEVTVSSRPARGPLEADYWTESYKTPPMWQLTGAYFVCGMTTAIIAAHYVPFAIDRGTSPGVAALAFGLMSFLNFVGVIGIGLVSDKFSRKNLLGTVYAVRGLAYAMLLLLPGMVGIWGFAVIAGMSWVATAPLTSSLTADIYGLKNIGTLNGMATFAHNVGGAISVLLAGVLYDHFGAYDVPFGIAGSLLIGASIAAFSVRERRFSIRYQPATTAVAGDGG